MVNLEVRKEDIPLILDGLFAIKAEQEDYTQHWMGQATAAKLLVDNIESLIDRITKQYNNL